MGRASFHRLAERELYDAVQYYDLESPGLGAAFLSEVDRCVQTILRYPEAGPVILGALHRRGWRADASTPMRRENAMLHA